MQHNITITYQNLLLRPVRKDDIEQLRIWRNDRERTKYLRQIGYVTSAMQEQWYQQCLSKQDEMTFVIQETISLKIIIGSLSLYDIQQNQAEIGRILVGDERVRGCGYGRLAFAMLLTYAFEKLHLQKVIATVNKNNIAARKSYFRLGFQIVGEKDVEQAGVEDVLSLDRATFIKHSAFFQEIKIKE